MDVVHFTTDTIDEIGQQITCCIGYTIFKLDVVAICKSIRLSFLGNNKNAL